MISFVWYIIALLCVLAAAVIGMDFSPSFTAMFLVAFLILTVLSELCHYFNEKRQRHMLEFLEYLLSIVGAILVIASVFIYAAGDDWLWGSIPITLIVSMILHFAIYVLFYRKQHKKMGVGAGVENCVLLSAGIFTIFCAIPSTALWPYGFGILLILVARRLKADGWLPRGIMLSGMLLCAVFLVAPMVF